MLVQIQPDRPFSSVEQRAKSREFKPPPKTRRGRSEHSSLYALSPSLISLVAQPVRASAFEAEGWWREPTRGCHFFCPRSPTAETTVSEAVQCRCNSCRGHHFKAPVAQCRGRRFKPGVSVSARLTGSTLLRLRSPTAETAASKPAQCECNSRRRHHLRLRSSVERVADYESAGRRCESCRRHHFNMLP